jgi:hypothetical protein
VVAEPAPLPWFPGLVLADPVPLPWFPGWPIDPGPLRSIDASRITPGLRDLVRGDATHLFVTDSLGQSLLVIDVKGGVAFDLNQNLAR